MVQIPNELSQRFGDPAARQEIMKNFGEAHDPFFGTNEEGDLVVMEVRTCSIVTRTFQSNGWTRINFYSQDGSPSGETYEKWKNSTKIPDIGHRVEKTEGIVQYGVQWQTRKDQREGKWEGWLGAEKFLYDNLNSAEAECIRLVHEGKLEDRNKRCRTMDVGGGIGAEIEYQSEMVVVKARVVKRYKTKWQVVEGKEFD